MAGGTHFGHAWYRIVVLVLNPCELVSHSGKILLRDTDA